MRCVCGWMYVWVDVCEVGVGVGVGRGIHQLFTRVY